MPDCVFRRCACTRPVLAPASRETHEPVHGARRRLLPPTLPRGRGKNGALAGASPRTAFARASRETHKPVHGARRRLLPPTLPRGRGKNGALAGASPRTAFARASRETHEPVHGARLGHPAPNAPARRGQTPGFSWRKAQGARRLKASGSFPASRNLWRQCAPIAWRAHLHRARRDVLAGVSGTQGMNQRPEDWQAAHGTRE